MQWIETGTLEEAVSSLIPFFAINFHPCITLCTVLEQEILSHPCHEKKKKEETSYLHAGLFFIQINFSVPLNKQQH